MKGIRLYKETQKLQSIKGNCQIKVTSHPPKVVVQWSEFAGESEKPGMPSCWVWDPTVELVDSSWDSMASA